jgi:glycogen debranching enzyme
MDQTRQVYVLPLTDDGSPDVPGGYDYILLPAPSEPPYLLRFTIEGSSPICRQGSLWVNIPAAGEKFKRSEFREHR